MDMDGQGFVRSTEIAIRVPQEVGCSKPAIILLHWPFLLYRFNIITHIYSDSLLWDVRAIAFPRHNLSERTCTVGGQNTTLLEVTTMLLVKKPHCCSCEIAASSNSLVVQVNKACCACGPCKPNSSSLADRLPFDHQICRDGILSHLHRGPVEGVARASTCGLSSSCEWCGSGR